MNLGHLGSSSKWVPKVILSWVVGQQISYVVEALMQDEINKNIITHRTLGPIPHKRIIPCDVVMLHEQNKV